MLADLDALIAAIHAVREKQHARAAAERDRKTLRTRKNRQRKRRRAAAKMAQQDPWAAELWETKK